MTDWVTISSLATAGGTLILAVATFSATRSANRSARVAERALLAHSETLHADVLVAPHHGSAEQTTSRFIDAVAPRAIVSSNAARLSAKQHLFNAETASIPLYRTSECGAVTIDIESDGRITITPFRAGSTPMLTWPH